MKFDLNPVIESINLADKFIEEIEAGNNMTWDEFFDKYNIPKSCRLDFAAAAIYQQVQNKYHEKGKKAPWEK